jgi:hypothetical protein
MEATADLGFVVPAEFRRTFDRVVRRLPTARGWVEVWPMLSIEAFLRCQVGSRSTFGADWRGVA